MSIDLLQEKIRKKKNALMVDLTVLPSELPPHLAEQTISATGAMARFCRELMAELRDCVPALRFSFSAFALSGPEGVETLQNLLKEASAMGYYVLLDAPEMSSPRMAEYTAEVLLGSAKSFRCDGVVVPTYGGTDMIKPFLPYCEAQKKDIFCVIRTANKSAPELQDLLTGSRLVHLAAADRVNRYSGEYIGKFGYSRVAFLAAASSPESLRTLRSKYAGTFLLADGLDYLSANMKNASLAFDKLGRGAAVCVGPAVTCAWKQEGNDGVEYVRQAAEAAEKLKKNLLRYISIL